MNVLMLKDEITVEQGRLFAGQIVDLSDGLAQSLIALGIAKPIDPVNRALVEDKVVAKVEASEPVHVGGGWYELPDGERVKGKAAAQAAMENE